jgi:endoglucanase
MQDPWVRGSGWVKGEIAPAKCYMDHVEAWSVNECTINWNAPLAWLSAFLSEENGGIVVGAVSAATPDSEQAENTATAASVGAASDATSVVSSNSSDTAFPVKIVLILAAVLVGLIAVEVFVYKLLKLHQK